MMNFLIRSEKEVANQAEVSSIISKVADRKLEKKLKEIEKVEEDLNYVLEEATAANESLKYR